MGGSQSTRSKTPPSPALSTTNPNLTNLGSLLGLRPATNHLSLPQISPVPILHHDNDFKLYLSFNKEILNKEDTEKCLLLNSKSRMRITAFAITTQVHFKSILLAHLLQ
jgi:hypothetical protein